MADRRTEEHDAPAPVRFRENGAPLVERLDDALGEASSGIGVLLSELVRRTLRGGVQKIEDEMQEFVDEKLDDGVATRMPEFEEVATRSASERAHAIATDLVDSSAALLEQQIRDVQREANETTQQKLSDLTSKSKSTLSKINTSMKQLQSHCKRVSEEVAEERERSSSSEASIREETRDLIDRLQARIDLLEAEIAELKKPKGIRAFFAWITGRGRKQEKQTRPSEAGQNLDDVPAEPDRTDDTQQDA